MHDYDLKTRYGRSYSNVEKYRHELFQEPERYIQSESVSKYALDADDLNRILAAVMELAPLKYLESLMEGDAAKGTPSGESETQEDQAADQSATRVATSMTVGYSRASSMSTPNEVARRAGLHMRAGKYKKFDQLQSEVLAEAAGQMRYSLDKPETPESKAAAVAAVAEQNARAGKYRRYDEIAHDLGL